MEKRKVSFSDIVTIKFYYLSERELISKQLHYDYIKMNVRLHRKQIEIQNKRNFFSLFDFFY